MALIHQPGINPMQEHGAGENMAETIKTVTAHTYCESTATMVTMVSGDGTNAAGGSRPWTTPEQTWFSTEAVPEHRRIADWEAHHATTLVGLRTRLGRGTKLRAQTSTLRLPRIRVAKVNGSPHSVRRSAEDVATHPVSGVVAYLPLKGTNDFTHRTGSITIGPGRGLICDGDTTFARDFTRGVSELVVQLPREALTELTGAASVRRPTPLDCELSDPLNSAARELMQLADGALDRGLRHGERLETRLLDLLTGVLERSLSDTDCTQEVLAVIAESHADPGLSASRLAQVIGVSERQLSRLFSATGRSVPQTILDARMTAARRMLADPAWAQAPMTEVASACGFRSQSQFSRSYASRFGVSPLRHRRQLLSL